MTSRSATGATPTRGGCRGEDALFLPRLRSTLRRYALALSLLPDPDAAGDLFMDAADEADLRRRAGAWRKQHGLPEPPEEPPLPMLNAEEQRHALHLAARARHRRRLRGWGFAGVAALAVALLAAGLAWSSGALAGLTAPDWAADPVFVGAAESNVVSDGGVTFRIHRAEATYGRVTLWWSAEGPGTVGGWKTLQPQLRVDLGNTYREGAIERSQTALRDRRRVVGRSTYRLVTAGAGHVVAKLALREHPVWIDHLATTQVGPDPDARHIPIVIPGTDFTMTDRPIELILGPGFAAVVYQSADSNVDRLSALMAGGNELAFVGLGRGRTDQLVEFFAPPPAGSTAVTLRLLRWRFRDQPIAGALPLSFPDGIRMFQKGHALILWVPQDVHAFLQTPSAEYDAAGHAYPLTPVEASQTGTDLVVVYEIPRDTPSDVVLTRASLTLRYQVSPPDIPIPLSP